MKIGYGSWLGSTGLKAQVIANKWNLLYNDEGSSWYVFIIDCGILHETRIFKDGGDDQNDFETNFKALGNKPNPQNLQAFASKTLTNGKNLFKRFTGASFPLVSGSNTFTWTQANYSLVKFVGVEVINAEIGDICSVYVLDTVTGTYSGIPNYPLNQFAYSANVSPNFYKYVSQYDSDLYQGLQIKFVYTSASIKTVYINFDMNEVK